MDELLTTAQTAQMLNVPEATLRWWRHMGTGPKAFKLGARKVMYRREDVAGWTRARYAATAAGV